MNRIPRRDDDQSFDLIPLMAHELRTSITTIKGLSQLALRRADLPPSATSYLTTVVESANQIAALVDDLDLSNRARNGEFAPHLSPVNVTSFLSRIVEDPSIVGGATDPVVVLSPDPVIAAMDVQLTSRALVRLLQLSARLARSDEKVYVGPTNRVAGAGNWIASCSRKPDLATLASPEKMTDGLDRDAQSDEVGPNLAVLLAASVIGAQGGRVHRGGQLDGTGFLVVLPEAGVS